MDDRKLWLAQDDWNQKWYILAPNLKEASQRAEKLSEDTGVVNDIPVVTSVSWISDEVFEA